MLRKSGLHIVIYLDDHPPPHVHVFGDGSAKITLGGDQEAPEVVRTAGMRAGELRKALGVVLEHRSALMEKWKEFHG